MYQILHEYLEAERKKKCGELIFKSKGHNFGKNQWIKTKLKLDRVYLGMAKQCTKYHNKHLQADRKKVRKL
jgi:hypothetical protein